MVSRPILGKVVALNPTAKSMNLDEKNQQALIILGLSALGVAIFAFLSHSSDAEALFAKGRQAMRQNDWTTAVAYYQKASDLGHPQAQNNLAIAYIEGLGVEPNPEKACGLFAQSAEKSPTANTLANVALCYDSALRDFARAFPYRLRAAELGDKVSQRLLADMYYRGDGTDKNPEQALFWAKKSAIQHDAQALYLLAHLYGENKNRPENQIIAYWYLKLADLKKSPDDALIFNERKLNEQLQILESQLSASYSAILNEWRDKIENTDLPQIIQQLDEFKLME